MSVAADTGGSPISVPPWPSLAEELRHRVLAEQIDIGGVRAVGDDQRPACVAGIARRIRHARASPERDIAQIDEIRLTEAGDETAIAHRVEQEQRAAAARRERDRIGLTTAGRTAAVHLDGAAADDRSTGNAAREDDFHAAAVYVGCDVSAAAENDCVAAAVQRRADRAAAGENILKAGDMACVQDATGERVFHCTGEDGRAAGRAIGL